MRVYVIRHGQSETNVEKRYTGWSQVNLTQQGIEEAIRIRPLLEGVKFDKIFSSDLYRAMQTAESAIPGCTYETSPLIREVGMGSLELQPIDDVIADMRAKNTKELGYAMYGGESSEEFTQRVAQFREQLESLDCETVAVFTHWGWMKNFLQQVLKVKIANENIVGKNCAVAIFEYDRTNWKLHSFINQ